MTLADAQVREETLDPQRSFCVSAPAGSGKTELLTQRLLALLVRVERPEQVLAITFTRKAAAEMRDRLLAKLDAARVNEPVSEPHEQQTRALALAVLAHARERGWSLDGEQLNLRTIDSLCADLTRQMPVLSALGGAVTITERDQPLFEMAVAELLTLVGQDSAAARDLWELLRHFDNDWERLRRVLVALLGKRGDWGGNLGQHQQPEQAARMLTETVASLVTSVLERVAEGLDGHLEELEALARFAALETEWQDANLARDHFAVSNWKRVVGLLITDKGEWRKPNGINKKMGFPAGCDERVRLQDVLSAVSEGPVPEAFLELRYLPTLSEEDSSWQLLLCLSRVLPILQAQLLLVFQREGRVDFAHVALAATEALGSDEAPTDLALRLDYQIEHLLVDEFQDTSVQQWQLLHRLVRGWAEHNALGGSQRTVFIVGDAMQSIYGFRDAKVALFLEAQERGIAGIPLRAVHLSSNFRSQAGLVDWVNGAFAELMPPRRNVERGEVSFTGATPVRTPEAEPPISAHLFADDEDVAEAEWIADTVASERGRDPAASVGILVRARGHTHAIVRALTARGIPFAGRDLTRISSTDAVTDLLSLSRWLANPADEIAAVALLRAPFCGLSLGAIHALLTEAPRPVNLRAVLATAPEVLGDDEADRAALLLNALNWGEARRDRLALPVWVEQIWLRMGGANALATEGVANAQRFFELLGQAEAERVGLDIPWLEAGLEHLYAVHDSTPETGGVEIMTLHKAKGLEFDLVFMPMLHKATRGDDRKLLRWHLHRDGDSPGLLIAADDGEKQAATLYNYLSWLQKYKDAAELRRLLYVGVTRARCRVWLSGQGKPDDLGNLDWPGSGTPMGLLGPLVPGDQVYRGLNGSTREAAPDDYLAVPQPPPSALMWRLPHHAVLGAIAARDTAGEEQTQREGSFLRPSLAGEDNFRQRTLGVVVHRGLELISLRGELPAQVDDALRRALRAGLLAEGVTGGNLDTLAKQAEEILDRALCDTTGRWILGSSSKAHSELALATLIGGAPGVRIIDRTFFDPDTHVRWIVDYKTSVPEDGEEMVAFAERQKAQYSDQLLTYAELLADFDEPAVPLRCALYFPAIPYWSPLDE